MQALHCLVESQVLFEYVDSYCLAQPVGVVYTWVRQFGSLGSHTRHCGVCVCCHDSKVVNTSPVLLIADNVFLTACL